LQQVEDQIPGKVSVGCKTYQQYIQRSRGRVTAGISSGFIGVVYLIEYSFHLLRASHMVYLTPYAMDSLLMALAGWFARSDGESRVMCKTVEVAWSLL